MFSEECLSHMKDKGLPFEGPIITDGCIHRYSSDSNHNKPDEWYVAYSGLSSKGNPYLFCIYGSWSDGSKFEYKSWINPSSKASFSEEELQALQTRLQKRMQAIQQEQSMKYLRTAETALRAWNQSTEFGEHLYLQKKQIKNYGIRFGQYHNFEAIIIPMKNIEGELRSLQFIYQTPEGQFQKRFLSGGEKLGNFHLIGSIDSQETLAIAEGYATGVSWHLGTQMSVAIAFDSSNLKAVAMAFRSKYPLLRILIVADDDVDNEKNIGREKALEAAVTSHCKVIFPFFPESKCSLDGRLYTDFNDLHISHGLKEVEKQFMGFCSSQEEPLNKVHEEIALRESLEKRILNTSDYDVLTRDLFEEIVRSKLRLLDKERLFQILADQAKIPLSTVKRSAKVIEASQRKANHLNIAHEVIHSYQKDNLLFSHGNIWKWSETGIWKIVDDKEMRQAIHAYSNGIEITKNMVDSTLDLIKTEIFIPDHQFDNQNKSINCLNGEIKLVEGKWELEPHCRENYRTTQIPVYYQPEAKAPRFKQFLGEIFLSDPDAEIKKAVVLEFMGYSTTTSVKFEKFILLIGGGSNGKSVLLHVVQALLGVQNICAIQPSQFDNRFQRAHFHGKLANIITEIAEGSVIPDAQLKAIVSGEKTTAEHKHKPPFDFHPFCKCWFGTNHMPTTSDFSDALLRRTIILSFDRKFEGAERDVYLKEKLDQELSGIFNMALSAYGEALKRGEFTYCPSSEEAKGRWQLECDQVALFVLECCELAPGIKSTSKVIYDAYKKWTHEMGYKKTVYRVRFTRRLGKFGVTPDKGTKGMRLLIGIRLKNFQVA